MQRKVFRAGAAIVLSIMATFAIAQVGHPAKGSWLGYWGPTAETQRRIVLQLDWQNGQLSGFVNPGPNAAAIKKATLAYDTWTLVVEADLSLNKGEPAQHWVATGKIDNLGSWSNRRFAGTYQYGTETGSFKFTLN
jgi:hypothetical protein